MTLWILFCRMSKEMDTLFAFYTSNRDDAEQQASFTQYEDDPTSSATR